MKREVTLRRANRPVGWLVFCIMIPLAIMTTANAGERAGNDIDGEPAPQEKQEKKFDRTFRTTFTDKQDGKEKKIELRYLGGELSEIIVDGKRVEEKEFQKYNDVIRKAEEEAEKIRKELLAIEEDIRRAMKDLEVDIKKAMEEIEKIDFAEINAEIARSMELMTDLRKDQISEALERARIDMAKARLDSRPEIERIRKEAIKEIERAREEMVRARSEIQKMRERGDFDRTMQEKMTILPDGPEPLVSAKKKEQMLRRLEELEKTGIHAMV